MTNTIASDPRMDELSQWIANQLEYAAPVKLTSIASDAGFRRYFRFAQPSQWLAVDAPPQTEDTRLFVALARYLREQGVSTPDIRAADDNTGFLLVEDFGDALLYRDLTSANVEHRYQLAFDTLQTLHRCKTAPHLIPLYDQPMLHRELMIFSEWFVDKLLGHTISTSEQAMLDRLFEQLEASALNQPQTLVHRDFHSRNLILRPATTNTVEHLGVIDFQGALWGGCTYDLVSLLRDCYVRWPADQVKHWALAYYQRAKASDLLPLDTTEEIYLQWFDWMGLQRHIKVLGIFARLYLRDGKPHYLNDLPLVIRYTLEVADSYPALAVFSHWFKQQLLPLVEQQPWHSPWEYAGDTK